MIENLVDKIINKQLEENIISIEEVNIYKYGYILVCEVFVNIIIALIIAGISGKWLLVILFLIIYIPLRSFCGGWHADKFWKCTIYSNLIIVLMLINIEYIVDRFNNIVFLSNFIICSICIFCFAPVDTKTKLISIDEKKVYRKKIRIIVLLHFIVYIMMILMDWNEIVYLITFSYVIQVIILFIEKVRRKKK